MTNCKHEVLRPTDYNDKNAVPDWNNGTIHGWNGGDCPVHPETVVQVWFRNGNTNVSWDAEAYWWEHRETEEDIIAFRVVKPYVEPRVLWVNEEADGIHVAYDSEEKASNCAAYSLVTRIAVKYVEVRE